MDPVPFVRIWSAAPTPLTADLSIDTPSVGKMIEDGVASGIYGVFLAGTCGEGPWLPNRQLTRLIDVAAKQADGRLKIAVQCTDNSVPRILENIRQAAESGADFAIIAPPATCLNATPERIAGLFVEAVDSSPLPVGIYDLGPHRPVSIPEERLPEIYVRPNVHLVKDSSGTTTRRAAALAARQSKPGLHLCNGDEFRCLEYLLAGYDGLMFGGAAVVASHLHRIVASVAAGRMEEARACEDDMRLILYGVYGGPSIACWLTGLKYYMVRRGLFSSTASYLGYPLTETCRAFIDAHVDGLARVRATSIAISAPSRCAP